MLDKIITALKKLDPTKDEHWTSDGLPRIDVVKELAGDPSITRDNIVAAAPLYNRSTGFPALGVVTPPVGTAPSAGTAPPAPPAPVVAPPPAPGPKKGDPEALHNAELAVADAQADIEEMDKWLAEANKERTRRMRVRDAAQVALDALQPIQTNGDAIQAYLAQQKRNLEARGQQIAKAAAFQKEHGFKLADLLPKRSPLDSAMARKNNRGTARPGSK